MGKSVNDLVLDSALNYLKSNGNKLCVCTSEPTSYSAHIATYGSASGMVLAETVIDSGDYTGPENGDTSGRKIAVDAQTSISIDASASAEHVAIVNTTASSEAILYVTTCTSQALTSGNKVNTPAWSVELRDPS